MLHHSCSHAVPVLLTQIEEAWASGLPYYYITRDRNPRQGAEFLHFNLFLSLA